MNEPLHPIDFPTPGLYPNMAAELYHAIEAISSSGAKKLLQSPQHYRLMREQKKEPSAAMELGTAVHTGVLEPERFADTVVVAPTFNKRTKDGKAEAEAFAAAHASAIVLDVEDYERALRTIAAIKAHPGAARLLDGAEVEGSMFWIDERYGVPAKARYDARNLGGLIDVKTTRDASPEEFARACASFLYHVQGAHYCSGARQILGEAPAFFAFIAAETEPPFGVACYRLPENALLAGAHRMTKALVRYAHALATGEWPGYPDTIDALKMPAWALRFDD